jgi:hypothetical protein
MPMRARLRSTFPVEHPRRARRGLPHLLQRGGTLCRHMDAFAALGQTLRCSSASRAVSVVVLILGVNNDIDIASTEQLETD